MALLSFVLFKKVREASYGVRNGNFKRYKTNNKLSTTNQTKDHMKVMLSWATCFQLHWYSNICNRVTLVKIEKVGSHRGFCRSLQKNESNKCIPPY